MALETAMKPSDRDGWCLSNDNQRRTLLEGLFGNYYEVRAARLAFDTTIAPGASNFLPWDNCSPTHGSSAACGISAGSLDLIERFFSE